MEKTLLTATFTSHCAYVKASFRPVLLQLKLILNVRTTENIDFTHRTHNKLKEKIYKLEIKSLKIWLRKPSDLNKKI